MEPVSIPNINKKYENGDALTMLTAYDAPIARQVDEAGVDMILVGDSAGDNHLGYNDTLPVTLEEALSNTAAVNRAVENAMVIGDMPFLSYGTSIEQSVKNAGKFMKEAGANAVKLETAPYGETTIEIVSRLIELGIPVVGHIGLTPQRMNQIGGGYVQGRGNDNSITVDALVETAEKLEDAGAFSIILEAVTEETGKKVTDAVDIPTIGIGAGRYVDGQVLVITDVLGLSEESYQLSKQYVNLNSIIQDAVKSYVSDVQSGDFPARVKKKKRGWWGLLWEVINHREINLIILAPFPPSTRAEQTSSEWSA
jgi:3-methyl-2-oxobutanoate hydroxymethyltransferase